MQITLNVDLFVKGKTNAQINNGRELILPSAHWFNFNTVGKGYILALHVWFTTL